MKIRKIVLIIFFYFLTLGNTLSIEADVFVQSTVNRASKILSENLSKNEKIDKLKIIAEETVDIRGIGFYTLGSIRKNLDSEQKKKYSRLFREYFFFYSFFSFYWLISSQSLSSWVFTIFLELRIFCCRSCKYKLLTDA